MWYEAENGLKQLEEGLSQEMVHAGHDKETEGQWPNFHESASSICVHMSYL